jgi:Fe2+ transport system protein FeoA
MPHENDSQEDPAKEQDVAELDRALTGPPVCETCPLSSVRKGELLEIMSVDDEHAQVQALRFGMSQGACVECITRIPAGPIVLKSGRQEIAVGRSLAERIQVRKRNRQHAGDEN